MNNKNTESFSNTSYSSIEDEMNISEEQIEQKYELLDKAMRENQPQLAEFANKEGFPEWYVEKAMSYVNTVKLTFHEPDEIGKKAEPVVLFTLNHIGMFPGYITKSHLASEYDDIRNGTDIVLAVQKDNKFGIFSIDVATGNSEKNIDGKFFKVFNESQPKVNLTPGHTNIDFCKMYNILRSEKGVLRFMIGINLGSTRRAIRNLVITQNGQISEIADNTELEQKIASELYEEAGIYLSSTINDGISEEEKIKAGLIRDMSKRKLCQSLKINNNDESADSDFESEYNELVRELSKRDSVFGNIIKRTRNEIAKRKTHEDKNDN